MVRRVPDRPAVLGVERLRHRRRDLYHRRRRPARRGGHQRRRGAIQAI